MLKQIWSFQLQVCLHIQSFSVSIRSWRVNRFYTYLKIMSFQLGCKKTHYYYMKDTKTRSFIKRQTSGKSSDNEWQRMTMNDNKWYNKWQQMATSDNKWYNEWWRVVERVTTDDNEWQRVATNDNEWQRVRAVVSWMKMAQNTSNNEWFPLSQ